MSHEISNMNAPFDLMEAKLADRAYGRLTDAEYITDEDQFTKAYTFAAHRSARHLHAALKEIHRLRRVNDEWGLVLSTLIDGLAEREIPIKLGATYAKAALDEIDRLRAALGPRYD